MVRILVVDDYAPFARSLRLLLAAEHEVAVCGGGREALELLEVDRAFDLILCDVAMEGVSGIDVWRQLQQRGDERKLVFMTGGTTLPETAEFLANAGNACLEKPFPTERLRQLLEDRGCP
jgi:CheY-like chemotaxis protein